MTFVLASSANNYLSHQRDFRHAIRDLSDNSSKLKRLHLAHHCWWLRRIQYFLWSDNISNKTRRVNGRGYGEHYWKETIEMDDTHVVHMEKDPRASHVIPE